MAGNSIGVLFRLTTAGESHGKALIGILDGVPPNLEIDEQDFTTDMERRRPGRNRFTTQRQEEDKVEILSGTFEGKTTGTPLSFLIANNDSRSKDYSEIAQKFRPGHADLTYELKYGIRDYRGGGRSSARETAIRVAAGVVAKKILHQENQVKVWAFVEQIGEVKAHYQLNNINQEFINQNPFFTVNPEAEQAFEEYIREIKKSNDSVGAKLKIVIQNLPSGLGEPVFDRLNADLAHALFSIPAVKAVEFGDGVAVVSQKGSYHRDQILPKAKFETNHSGGTLGGISTGQDLIISVSFKPTSSIQIPAKTIDYYGNETTIVTKGRHDPCVGIRAVPICEAMTAIILVDHLMRYKAQCHLWD